MIDDFVVGRQHVAMCVRTSAFRSTPGLQEIGSRGRTTPDGLRVSPERTTLLRYDYDVRLLRNLPVQFDRSEAAFSTSSAVGLFDREVGFEHLACDLGTVQQDHHRQFVWSGHCTRAHLPIRIDVQGVESVAGDVVSRWDRVARRREGTLDDLVSPTIVTVRSLGAKIKLRAPPGTGTAKSGVVQSSWILGRPRELGVAGKAGLHRCCYARCRRSRSRRFRIMKKRVMPRNTSCQNENARKRGEEDVKTEEAEQDGAEVRGSTA